MKNKELFIILSQIPNNQHTYYTKKYNLHTRKITLLLEKSKKPEKAKITQSKK